MQMTLEMADVVRHEIIKCHRLRGCDGPPSDLIQGMIGPDPTMHEGTERTGFYPGCFFHKGGMINFTRFMASYYGARGVRCNCLNPGGFRTDKMPEAFVKNYSRRTFLGRLAGDTDLMGAVVFLASDASAYITGANLVVDGGYTAK